MVIHSADKRTRINMLSRQQLHLSLHGHTCTLMYAYDSSPVQCLTFSHRGGAQTFWKRQDTGNCHMDPGFDILYSISLLCGVWRCGEHSPVSNFHFFYPTRTVSNLRAVVIESRILEYPIIRYSDFPGFLPYSYYILSAAPKWALDKTVG